MYFTTSTPNFLLGGCFQFFTKNQKGIGVLLNQAANFAVRLKVAEKGLLLNWTHFLPNSECDVFFKI